MNNGERTNVYTQVRNIVGLDVNNVSEGVFRLMDYLNESQRHNSGSPFLPNFSSSPIQQRRALTLLPNDAFPPGGYRFILDRYGGIGFGDSRDLSGAFTGALRSLNIPSEQFNADFGYFVDADGEPLRAPPYNLGLIVIDGQKWFYNGNFPYFKTSVICERLFPEERLTLENLTRIQEEGFRGNGKAAASFFYENADTCDFFAAPN